MADKEFMKAVDALVIAAAPLAAEASTWADKDDGFHLYFGGGSDVSKWPITVGQLRALFRALDGVRSIEDQRGENE